MHFVLMGLPGKLKEIKTTVAAQAAIWTQTLANRLDVATSTRAPADTALTKTTWTDEKAAHLDDAITSRVGIKKITQADAYILSGEVSVDVTVPAYDVANSELIITGQTALTSSAGFEAMAFPEKVDSTTIRFRRGDNPNYHTRVGYILREYK